ncbi:DNA recombination protein RmuC [Thalassotalea aquiviva]|uniref:DNA recombination protein RmuC n=1 Tax=Thalassotalea aquiviva TaxID=3242415 RepID=UPI00352B0E86
MEIIDLNLSSLITLSLSSIVCVLLILVCWQQKRLKYKLEQQSQSAVVVQERLQQFQQYLQQNGHNQQQQSADFLQTLGQNQLQLQEQLNRHREQFNHNQLRAIDQLVHHLNQATKISREELAQSLKANAELLAKQMSELSENTDKRLQSISMQVEKRLAEGFDKTTKTFNDIVQRLALIDDAQKKITELSTNVVSLQEVLADKRSRGAFGEVQLNGLIRNVLPEKHFSIQHTLSNGKVADCVLFLPEPTGNVVIDSKFPLESYRTMTQVELSEHDRKQAQRQFKADIKKHINDISTKYLIEKETSDGAVMFIPAEAIFAEIHAHYPDLVEYAYKMRVWLSSPTTLMAILTTARSVLKDEATRQQVHVIQEHLSHLGADFSRFKTRFNNLAKHIDQAATDVKQIHTSADKISSRFEKIEKVELNMEEVAELMK